MQITLDKIRPMENEMSPTRLSIYNFNNRGAPDSPTSPRRKAREDEESPLFPNKTQRNEGEMKIT